MRESPVRERQCVYGVLSERDSVCVRERERVSPRMGGSRRSIGSRIARIGFSAGSCHLELLRVAVQGLRGSRVCNTVSGFCFMFPGFWFQVSWKHSIGSRIASIGSSAGSCVALQDSGVVRDTVFGFWFIFPGFRFQGSGLRFQV